MHQLSGLDATFLHLESPEMPMHVGALEILELPRGHRGSFANDLRRLVAARLPLLPAFRRRLWWMPLNLANPAWVDAEPDLDHHIAVHRLPASARHGDGLAELQAAVAALHAELLDRRRPLWRFHVLEGLGMSADGCKRVAVYSQLHHAAVDGQAAVALANVLFDLTPEPRTLELRPSRRAKVFQLGMVEMLRGAVAGELQQIGHLLRELPAGAGSLARAAGSVAANAGLLGRAPARVSNLALAPRTLLNATVGTSRAFAGVSLPLAGMKALAKAHGCSLNDLLLACCAGALRRYFAARGLPVPRKPMVAAVPISLRAAGDATADNQASMSFVSLGTHLADARRRLAHIQAATAAMKATMGQLKAVLPTDFPSIGVPWLMEAARAAYGRAHVAEKIPPVATLVISNVPGPQVPLYLAGARVRANYPTSIVVHGLALNVTAQSLDQQLDIGCLADAQAMPDVALFAQAVGEAHAELLALAPADAPPATPAGARAAKKNSPARPRPPTTRARRKPVAHATTS